MKQLIFALCFVVGISIWACIYIMPSVTEWTEYGRNDFRNMIVAVITIGILPHPLTYITVSLAKLFFPEKRNKMRI